MFQRAAYPNGLDIAVLTPTTVHRLVNQVAGTATPAAGCADGRSAHFAIEFMH